MSPLPRILVVLACALMLIPGCRSERLDPDDVDRIEAIIRSGLEMNDDPHVRAETVRVIALTEDTRLATWAAPLTRDRDAMVRLAALRTLLLVSPDAASTRARAMSVFARGNEAERLQVIELVLEHGDEATVQAVLERALQSESGALRYRSLEAGMIPRLRDLHAQGESDRLRQDLLPELGTFVDDEDPRVAALALASLIEFGQYERADRFISRFSNAERPLEERLAAGTILLDARAERAEPAFRELLESVGAFDPNALGVPQRRVDQGLLRIAVLGMVALGHDEFVSAALEYRAGASADETVQLLHALRDSAHPDASITLSTAMRDASPQIRYPAIELYGARQDAQFSRLRGAMDRDDYRTQMLLSSILAGRFAEDWQRFLEQRLQSTDPQILTDTLRSMQVLLRTPAELEVMRPLVPSLRELAGHENAELSGVATYLLFRLSDDIDAATLGDDRNPQTRFAFLEHLIREGAEGHVAELRQHLRDDYFALQLLAAAGLVRAFGDQIDWEDLGDAEDEADE